MARRFWRIAASYFCLCIIAVLLRGNFVGLMRTALYTRRQKKVWVMFAYNEMNHEADEIKVFRTAWQNSSEPFCHMACLIAKWRSVASS